MNLPKSRIYGQGCFDIRVGFTVSICSYTRKSKVEILEAFLELGSNRNQHGGLPSMTEML